MKYLMRHDDDVIRTKTLHRDAVQMRQLDIPEGRRNQESPVNMFTNQGSSRLDVDRILNRQTSSKLDMIKDQRKQSVYNLQFEDLPRMRSSNFRNEEAHEDSDEDSISGAIPSKTSPLL